MRSKEKTLQLRALLAVALFLGMTSLQSARASDFPNRPVRLIVAFSAGGSVDALGRILAQKLTELWDQQVSVENRTGALGNIGAVAARALVQTATHFISPPSRSR
jgi:tripartite-type tricarboxylate transporter receptor subunit TctC